MNKTLSHSRQLTWKYEAASTYLVELEQHARPAVLVAELVLMRALVILVVFISQLVDVELAHLQRHMQVRLIDRSTHNPYIKPLVLF